MPANVKRFSYQGRLYVYASEHETEVSRLSSEIARLQRLLQRAEGDAERWRYARQIFAVEDIEVAQGLCGHPSHVPSEIESRRADHAIDEARRISGPSQRAPIDVDDLAQIIRVVDGQNCLGAAALAEAILANWPDGAAPARTQGAGE